MTSNPFARIELDRGMLDDRPSGLVGEKRRCQRPAAFELVDRYALRLRNRRRSGRWTQGALLDLPRIGIIDDFNFAAAPGERMNEVANVIAVPAKIAWRIEGRHQRNPGGVSPSWPPNAGASPLKGRESASRPVKSVPPIIVTILRRWSYVTSNSKCLYEVDTARNFALPQLYSQAASYILNLQFRGGGGVGRKSATSRDAGNGRTLIRLAA